MAAAAPGPSRHVRTLWLGSTVIIAVLIAVLTLMPDAPMPRNQIHLDKLAHMAAFFGLVFPTAALWPRVTAWIGLLAVLYGGAIEIIQPYTGRSAEWADLLADGIGVGLGIVFGMVLRRVIIARRTARRTARR
ncbi:MAG: VanZ family protein [Maritimibacter sp.]|nr:VanZ family protein [Maritimibacter sp.]